ncbi:hemolysin BL lytic component L2, partial [Bacillus thuringiensis]
KEVTAEAFTARLDSLQSNIAGNKGKLQTYLNELEKLKADVASNIKNLDENVKEGQLLLNGKDGKNSKIAKIKEDLQATHATIDKDLELIALAPGALNTAGWELFKDLYAFSKDIIDPVAKAAIERAAKGQEAEKNVQDAVDKAEKEAKEKNKDISAEDLEKATKEAREKAEKENEKDLKDYKDLLLEAFPFAKATDQATLKKLFDEFGKLNTLTVAEMKSVQDLPVQNQKIYDLTKQLTVIESQQAQMLLLQNEMQQFTQKLDTEIVLMKEYKKDWDLMSTSITKLAAAKTDEEKNTALDRFAKLSKQLGKQVQQLDH